jgi:hypothetical protein
MPYWLRFSVFLIVASALAFIGGQLISEFGLMADIPFAIIKAYCGPSSSQGKALT